jgi:hypothetical protein
MFVRDLFHKKKKGANVQTQPTPTPFRGELIKKTLEGFVHYPYLYYNYFLTN